MDRPAGGGSDGLPKISPALTIVSVALAAVHLALGICGLVNIAAVVFLPIMCAFIQSTIYVAFTMMIKSNHYDMLAGFDPKKDSIRATRLQMYWAATLSGLTTVLFELIFVLIYFVRMEKQMDRTVIMIFSYYAAEVIVFIAISLKIKSRT